MPSKRLGDSAGSAPFIRPQDMHRPWWGGNRLFGPESYTSFSAAVRTLGACKVNHIRGFRTFALDRRATTIGGNDAVTRRLTGTSHSGACCTASLGGIQPLGLRITRRPVSPRSWPTSTAP